MAGSYRHITSHTNEFIGVDLLDHLGDAYEALEECYDMIAYLSGGDLARIAEASREGHYRRRMSERVDEEPELFTNEAFWRNDDE